MKPLSEREMQTLRELAAANKNFWQVGIASIYVKPMDCGSSNGSHHSYTLTKMEKYALVVSIGKSKTGRGSKRYCVTSKGLDVVMPSMSEKLKAEYIPFAEFIKQMFGKP